MIEDKAYSSCVEIDKAHKANTLRQGFPYNTAFKMTIEQCWEECQKLSSCQFWNYVDDRYSGINPERFMGACYLKTTNRTDPSVIKGYVAGTKDCKPVKDTSIEVSG